MDVPLPQSGPNVNPDAEQSMKLQNLRLVSSPAALPTSFAIGAHPPPSCTASRCTHRLLLLIHACQAGLTRIKNRQWMHAKALAG